MSWVISDVRAVTAIAARGDKLWCCRLLDSPWVSKKSLLANEVSKVFWPAGVLWGHGVLGCLGMTRLATSLCHHPIAQDFKPEVYKALVVIGVR